MTTFLQDTPSPSFDLLSRRAAPLGGAATVPAFGTRPVTAQVATLD